MPDGPASPRTASPRTDRLRTAVWATGNMGRAATRAVLGHPDLDLAAVWTSSPARVGTDAGELAGTATAGVAASPPPEELAGAGVDAVAYMASGDIRPDDAAEDVRRCLAAGLVVVTPALYALYDPTSAPAEVVAPMEEACRSGGGRLFASGVDPGWGNDTLALLASGLCHSIAEVRCQEIFDYSTYDQEFSVRELVGMGKPLDEVPPMVLPGVPSMVWGGQVHLLARHLGVELDAVVEHVEHVALDRDVDTALGRFDAGTRGGLRFEVTGTTAGGAAPIVIEHVTRIHPTVAPEWPRPDSGAGAHRVVVTGEPHLVLTMEAEAEGANRAAGGNATAAMRLVGAIPWLATQPPGLYDGATVPLLPGVGRVQQAG